MMFQLSWTVGCCRASPGRRVIAGALLAEQVYRIQDGSVEIKSLESPGICNRNLGYLHILT
jgi:hypothetical protein